MLVLSRKERDRLRRKTDILEAAEHIFALKGYEKATVQDIAEQAEYSIGTIYLYFKDKYDLYFSLLEEKLRSLLLTIKEKTAAVSTPRESLEVCVKENLAFFENNKDFFKIFSSVSEELQYSLESKIEKSPLMPAYLEYVEFLMQKAREEGLVRKEIDPFQAANVFLSGLKLMVTRWLRQDPKERRDLNSMANFIIDVIFYGIGQRHG